MSDEEAKSLLVKVCRNWPEHLVHCRQHVHGLLCCTCVQSVRIALWSVSDGSKTALVVQEAVAVMEQQIEQERQQVRVEREAAEQKVSL